MNKMFIAALFIFQVSPSAFATPESSIEKSYSALIQVAFAVKGLQGTTPSGEVCIFQGGDKRNVSLKRTDPGDKVYDIASFARLAVASDPACEGCDQKPPGLFQNGRFYSQMGIQDYDAKWSIDQTSRSAIKISMTPDLSNTLWVLEKMEKGLNKYIASTMTVKMTDDGTAVESIGIENQEMQIQKTATSQVLKPQFEAVPIEGAIKARFCTFMKSK